MPAFERKWRQAIPVLVDVGFHRGTGMLSLGLGAGGVLVTRPPLWGLAACGKPNLAAIDRSLVKIHRR